MADLNDAVRRQACDDAVACLRALLRFDTTNPPGNERPAVGYIAGVLRQAGIEPRIFEPAPRRANLVARIAGDGTLPPLLLTSHLDTVPADGARWSHPPFAAHEADGFIWGRGAIDMKGMTAFELATLLALKRSGLRLRRDVIFLALADEEDGMTWGSRWMVEHQPDLISAEFALNEVGGFSAMVGRKRIYPVGVAEKGVCWLRLTAKGESGHGALPPSPNAVAVLTAAVDRLAKANLGSHVGPVSQAFIEQLAVVAGKPRSLLLRGLLNRATRETALRLISRLDREQGAAFRAMLHDTVTPTGLRAGDRPNVVPGTAEAILDGRVLPGTAREAFLARVRRVAGPGINVEVLTWGDPTETDINSTVLDAIRSVAARLDPGASVLPWLNAGFTDASQLSRLGIKTFGYYPLLLPPGTRFSTLFHGDDERVPVDGYRFGFRLFLETVLALVAPQAA